MTYGYQGDKPDLLPVRVLVFDLSKCGTRKGFKQHQNHGVPVCPPCAAAHNEYMKAYYKAKREAA